MKTTLKKTLALLAFATALGGASALHAQTFNFNVDINTSALTTAATGPYSLDFQLNYGSGPSNTATVSNFVFTGGTPTGSATTFENASGDMSSSLVLGADSVNAFNELYQGFGANTTDVKFKVSLTQNGSGVQPTGFFVNILDNSLTNIVTTDPNDGINYAMLSVPLSNSNHLSDIATFTSTSPAGVTVSVSSAVPEPSTWAMLVLGGAAMLVAMRLRKLAV